MAQHENGFQFQLKRLHLTGNHSHKNFQKPFDSEKNKQHQRVLGNKICKFLNATMKQLAVITETLVRKFFSLNKHDYKNTKMTEILMMISKTYQHYSKDNYAKPQKRKHHIHHQSEKPI